jgi:hypothetical protein
VKFPSSQQGPAISPTAFEKPRADSAYADAHCAIASSDAPEQTIITMAIRNMGFENNFLISIPCPSSTNDSIGQVAKLIILIAGINAKITASHFQLPIPNSKKKPEFR